MKFRALFSATLIPITALSLLLGCGAKPEPFSLEKTRDEAAALVQVQSILSWYSNCVGEKSLQGQTYKGHEDLFSGETIADVEKLIAAAGEGDEKRALVFLRNYLVSEYVSLKTAHFYDRISDAETAGKVRVTGLDGEIAYRDLDILLDNEEDPAQRENLQAAQARFWEETLNPIHEEKTAAEHAICAELGYGSYVELAEEMRNVDLQHLVQMSGEQIEKMNELYATLFAGQTEWVLGIAPDEFRRSDIGRLSQVSSFNRFFPKELVIPSFRAFLKNIGLDMNSAEGTPIHVNDDSHPMKDPRAVCYAMAVPSDVRISVKPSGGVPDFEVFFHEGGHAIHFANGVTPVWEFQQLGNNTVTEAYAGLFEGLWGDPDWLKWYREYVRDYNRFVDDGEEVPLMTDMEIALLVKNRAFWDIYYMRRYAGAKLVYEAVLHGGDPAIYAGEYDGSAGEDMHETYRVLFSEAYGFEMTSTEALRFRTDVDPFFYSADYARSYALSKQIHEGLSKKFGDPWWRNEQVGRYLKDEFWHDANKLQGDEAARALGYEDLNWEAFERELTRRLAFAESVANQ